MIDETEKELKRYYKCPNVRAWKMYYEYIDTNNTYRQMANKYGVSGERIRQLVGKVIKYLKFGNTRILTREQVKQKEV